MQPEAKREAREWLVRAEQDLLIADRALEGAPLPAQAAFHAQQAAEKTLKSFLTAHNLIFPKTHNLEELVSLAQTIDMNLAAFGPAARILTPYANRFRYPGGPLQPEPSVAREAITLAEIYDDVQQRLIGGGSS